MARRTESADVVAHVALNERNGNGNGGSIGKWTGEIIRMLMVMLASLAVSYLALQRAHASVVSDVHADCIAQDKMRENQQTELLFSLDVADALEGAISPASRSDLLAAIGNLPDPRNC